MTQRWKNDPNLYDCKRRDNKKDIDYYDTYIDEFLGQDELRDWESIKRCINLWDFFISVTGMEKLETKKILDCGTKDGQFPYYLKTEYGNSDVIGIEIEQKYVEYAQSKNRPVEYGDVCNLKYKEKTFDVVFSHHCLGLCPDYQTAFQESLRVTKTNGYVVTLNDCPGNSKKHYSMVDNTDDYVRWLFNCIDNKVLYFDYWSKEREKEFVIILQRL